MLNIPALNQQLAPALQQKINLKTKPLGALGRLEALALQIGLIQQTLSPELKQPVAYVFAGDHGIVKENISPFPQAVTQQMVLNFVQGGAAINGFAKLMGFDLRVVDAGVNADFDEALPILHCKIAKGTHNFLHAPAMTAAQCQTAIQSGANLVLDSVKQGSNVFAFGEMGIGNTTSAAAMMAVLCKVPVVQCAGRGTGLDHAGVQHKIWVIEQAITLHAKHLNTPAAVLAHLGGFEIAMIVGAMLQAASAQTIVLVDGFIASAAALVASKMQPHFLQYCIFSHRSNEAGHRNMLAHLQAQPLLDLDLRLGEGTGAVLAYPMVQAAVDFLNNMASFESAGVSEKCV